MRFLDALFSRPAMSQCFQQEALALGQQLYSTDLGIVEVGLSALVGCSVRCQETKSDGGLGRARIRLPRAPRPLIPGRRQPDPTIRLWRLGDQYFVDEGHSAVRRAQKRGDPTIRGRVIVYAAPSGDMSGLLARAQSRLAARTGITNLEFPSPDAYLSILAQITDHHAYLEKRQARLIEFREAVVDWEKTILWPFLDGVSQAWTQLPQGGTPEELLERVSYFLGRLARRESIPLSQALLDVVASPLPWFDKLEAVLPPCQLRGECPF